ncbi:MAG: hypothetical protein GY820_20550 [Gammaproteobacteria bacterium]|nr:hypothetical protein [Gammaproteobacteria bacterium]
MSPCADQFCAIPDTPLSRMPLKRANSQVPTAAAKGAFRGVSLCGHCKDIIVNVLEYFGNCGIRSPFSETLKACQISYKTLQNIQIEAKTSGKVDEENGETIATERRFDIDRPIKQYRNFDKSCCSVCHVVCKNSLWSNISLLELLSNAVLPMIGAVP